MRAAAFQAQWRGIGVGGTDAKIRGALVVAMHLALGLTRLGDPVMPCGIRLGKLLVFSFTQGNWQGRWWCRCRCRCRCRLGLPQAWRSLGL
jgi:hypothetical protein